MIVGKKTDNRRPESQSDLPSASALRLRKEMQQQQIQLEMLNEELRRARAAVEASQARYFDFYNVAPVGYLTITIKGLIAEANLTMATLLGVSKESLIRQPLTNFVFPEDQDCYHLHIKQLFATGASEACELRLRNKGGRQFWARMESILVRDADDATLCHAVVLDVTERKQAEESLKRNVETQTVLRNIAETAALSISIEELCRSVRQLVGRVLPAENFNIVFRNEAAAPMASPCSAGKTGIIPQRKPAGSYMTEYVMLQRRAMHVTSADFDRLRLAGDVDSRLVEIKEWMGAPLIDSQGEVFGAVTLFSLSDGQSFRPEDLEMLSSIAAQVSLAIACKQLDEELRRQATTDGLTGLFNRRHFLARADEELQRIHRYGGTCALLMLDMDNFKLVNDSFGHAAGDAVLQRFATLCRETARSTDLLGRVGGDEFAILLLETGILEARKIADRLLLNIRNTIFGQEESEPIKLGASIGMAEHQSKKEDFSELMIRADKALYRAKSEGRNRVVEAG